MSLQTFLIGGVYLSCALIYVLHVKPFFTSGRWKVEVGGGGGERALMRNGGQKSAKTKKAIHKTTELHTLINEGVQNEMNLIHTLLELLLP